jgi:4-hydroxy-tetrahydrodipicolinate reductase
MGQLIAHLIESSEEFELAAQIDSRGSLESMLGADLVVDVTIPAVSQAVVEFAITHGMKILVGTSGWSSDRIDAVGELVAAQPSSAVIFVPNFSLGSVLATSLSAIAARFFDSIEIVESHHSSKVDSPSGTAVRTAEQMAAARVSLGPVAAPHADQRARGQQVSSIPIHSLRMVGVVAKQDVIFGGTGELLTISHETVSPSSYEAGILLSLQALRTATGVTVGLDQIIDLGIADSSN